MKEWEFQRARLHHRDSAKFTKLTPREASAPFEREADVADLLIFFGSLIGIIVLLLIATVLR